jgi:hypothetical protein
LILKLNLQDGAMGIERIVCLANSYKHENRCVAGISLTTKKWVRLVGRQAPGCVTVQEASYANRRPAAILDLFEAELGEACGSCAHPEDVYITGRPWNFLRRFERPEDRKFLQDYCSTSTAILQSCEDRIYVKKLANAKTAHSLELAPADDLWWWVREDSGKRKNRALFRCGRVGRTRYDLAVTDPVWLEQLALLPAGIYPHSMLCVDKSAKTLLAISLSEPFEGFHYKLVAGVVQLPVARSTERAVEHTPVQHLAVASAASQRIHFQWPFRRG